MKNFNLTEINDIYFISEKIKTINKNFKLFYNQISKHYEIHDISQKDSFGLVKKLYYTNKENMKNLFEEIELNNNKLQERFENNTLEHSKLKMNEIFKYQYSNPGKSLSNKQIDKILERGE